jgi:hypothetical protein
MYYAFGLNLKGTSQKDYIGKRELFKLKDKTEFKIKKFLNASHIQYDAITRDKFYAASVLQANSIPCIPTLALISHSKLIFNNGEKKELEDIMSIDTPFFLKNILLDGGDGVYHCTVNEGNFIMNGVKNTINEIKQLLTNNIWVVQKKVNSHAAIKKVNDSALNTTRIVTISNGQYHEYLTGFQAFATNDVKIDSWSMGSVYVGIDLNKKCLKEFGFCNLSDKDRSIITEHPNSKVVFKDYPIPFLQEAVNLCLRAHQLFYFNFIIGWDVAITDNGPVIVEINEKPGMNVVQCVDGGLREKINRSYEKLICTLK